MIRIAFALSLALASSLAAAEDAAQAPASPSEQARETIAVQAWGSANRSCPEWSDGCVVCTQDGCSTPGIACTPREITCRKP